MQNVNIQDAREQVVYVSPNEEINLIGLNPANIKVDVLGADFIVTDVDTGSRIVFPNLGLILFSPDDLPTFSFDGQIVSEDFLLNDLGLVQNISESDLLSFTSLETDPEQGTAANEIGTQGLAEEVSEEEESVDATDVAEMEAILYDIASYSEPPGSQGQVDTGPLNANDVASETETETERQSKLRDLQEEFQEPPAKKQSSTSTKQSDLTEIDETDSEIDIDFSVQIFNFTAGLVQRSNSVGTEDVDGISSYVYRGGGGGETSYFSPDSVSQFSTEIIDTTGETGQHYIYADNPEYFSTSQITRVLQITPNLADGFDLSRIVMSGLPPDFMVEGAVRDGSDFIITNPVIESDGRIRISMSYDIPGSTSFNLDISATAVFDPDSGVPTPELTEVTQEMTRNVIFRNVSQIDDYNAGADTWVLSNTPNANRIFTGTGDAIVYGNSASDTVTSFDGNDQIYSGAGNDIIRTSDGDDYVDPGTGNNLMDAGAGNDTLDYSSKTNDIIIDLTRGGFQNVSIGQFTDQIANFENILTGSGDDRITAPAGDALIITGAGHDTVIGNIGNDRFEGGDGIDTIDYSYASNNMTIDLRRTDANGDLTLTVSSEDIDTINSFENVIGTRFNDDIWGNNEENILFGGGGNDNIYGVGNGDYLDGGNGNDYTTFSVSDFGITLDLSVRDDDGYATATFTNGDVRYFRNIEQYRDSYHDDVLIGDERDNFFRLTTGNDVVNGNEGTDTVSFSAFGSSITLDLVNMTATTSEGMLDSFTKIEQFYTTNLNDIIYTTENDDWVSSLSGNDYFYASAGDDIYDGAGGYDTINYSAATGPMDINLATDIATGWGRDTLSGIDNVIGSNYDDLITLQRYKGVIDGMGGTDTLDVSAVNGANINMASLNGDAYFSVIGNNNTYLIRNVQNINGSDGNGRWIGDSQDNIFNGRGGNDTFIHSLGDDTYIGGDGVDTLNYTGYTNPLTVDMSMTNANGYYEVAFDNTAKTDQFTGMEVLYGSNADDTITGDSSGWTFYGGGGNDIINGGNGTDRIYDGAGADIISGGGGNDYFYANTSSNENDIYNGGGGYDRLFFMDTLSTIVVNTDTQTATGTNIGSDSFSGMEEITTSFGSDIFNGSGGADIFLGLGGNDIFYSSGGNDRFNGGDNLDTVNYTGQTSGVTFNMNASSVSKSNGTDSFDGIERFEGSNFNDTFLLNNSSALIDYSSISGNGGFDRVVVQTPATFDGVNMASVFSGIEEIDFTGSSLLDADIFGINGNDVKFMTDANDSLRITANPGFTVNVSDGTTYAITNTNMVGNTTTYTFDNGGGDTVTLDVQTA